MERRHIVIVGGGAAGCFAASACVQAAPGTLVTVLERGPQLLSKVKISGGGRCNVTHACFEPRVLSNYYPRGGQELHGAFHRFQPRDTIGWFENRGVKLKVENDGRMFPVTDSSQTIIDCLIDNGLRGGVIFRTNQSVASVLKKGGAFEVHLHTGEKILCDRLLLATGGCRVPAAGALAVSLGHSLQPPVPSLFTFELNRHWLQELPGIALDAELYVPQARLRVHGPVLLTHRGLSGPAVLKLSAWGARIFHQVDYRFTVRGNWVPKLTADQLMSEFSSRRKTQSSRFVVNLPLSQLPARFWEAAVLSSGIGRQTRWAELSRLSQHTLTQQLVAANVDVIGKSLNKDEFVTCGGVSLREVEFKTMESRFCPGLYFAGELLDIDGLTGGFNFQAAWTTGWIAGNAMVSET